MAPGITLQRADLIESYTFWAPGVAVRAEYNPIGNFVVTARGGFAYTVSPTMSGSGDVPKEVATHVFSLDQHDVWRTGLGMDYATSHHVHAFASLDYARFGFGASASTSAGPIVGENIMSRTA